MEKDIKDIKETAKNQKVVIIDTGCANVSSVQFAIERLGYSVIVSKAPHVVLAADKLFLPGVGTASEAMKNLAERDLIELVRKVDKPLLGICLGMQLLGKLSFESGSTGNCSQAVECLALCDGEVHLMDTGELPLPHMGWNTVVAEKDHPLFKGIKQNEYFYFVHSYAMPIGKETVATCHYGNPFTAVVQRDHYYGVQFHPERSSKAGSRLIQNFLEL